MLRISKGKMKDSKVLFFDVETTGTDPKIHDIIQLAFLIEVNGVIKERQNIFMQPFRYDTIDEKALEVNKLTLEQIKKFPHPRQVYPVINKVFSKYVDKYDKNDKFYPAGYNVYFDLSFLFEYWNKNDDPYFGSFCNWHRLDPLAIAFMLEYTGKIPPLENYKLETVCNFFKIQIKAHDAMSDITATRELLLKMQRFILPDCFIDKTDWTVYAGKIQR